MPNTMPNSKHNSRVNSMNNSPRLVNKNARIMQSLTLVDRNEVVEIDSDQTEEDYEVPFKIDFINDKLSFERSSIIN